MSSESERRTRAEFDSAGIQARAEKMSRPRGANRE